MNWSKLPRLKKPSNKWAFCFNKMKSVSEIE